MTVKRKLTEDPTGAALDLVKSRIVTAVRERGRAVISLAGGSTPLPLYERLRDADLPWESIYVAFGDERFVPPTHPDSNFGSVNVALLSEVPLERERVLAWPILASPEGSAAAYGELLKREFGGFPTFDVTLLGLGEDAHTASLFPGTGAALLRGPTLAVRAPEGVRPAGWRLSMSAPALSGSRCVLFLVIGEGKKRALELSFGPREVNADAAPARAITALEDLYLLTDVEF